MSPAPFDEYREVVRPEWIDENRHLNMGYYVVIFDRATDAWLDHVGLDGSFKDRQRVTTFTLESHVTYQREIGEGEKLRFTTQLIDFDPRRIHYFHRMYRGSDGELAATNELMSLHVSQDTRRAAPMASAILERLAELQDLHADLPPPAEAGRRIGLRAGRAGNA